MPEGLVLASLPQEKLQVLKYVFVMTPAGQVGDR